ncbi:Protein CBG01385 [Caenorhabditis briggsae]|uniref:Protein CBG01385 n=1 Tax=Caenorhabditis briggsae TaxID=6238 RepID=A8WQA4_CAEBR|nr:Protein CBG01385 [Caenorhabditis briggsae]CAP22662.1 Protein CBG01385 [Caenorhabditis briggsae]
MILVLIFTTLLAILIVRHYQKVRKLPPGPITLPLIGNNPQIVYYSWKNNGIVPAFEYFRKKYGNVFTLWLGPFPHVSIADFETNHEVFVKNGNRYKDRFLSPIFEELQEDHGLVFANGEKWAELRKFTMVTFRNMGVGNEIMEEKIMEELDARCADLDNEAIDGKTVVEHGKLFELMVGSVINSLLVGNRFGEDNKEEFLHIRHLIETFNEVFTTFDMIMPVWVLKTFFPTRYAIAADGMNAIKDYVGRVAEKRFEEVKSGKYVLEETNPKDYVDAFLIKIQKEKDHPAYTMKSLKYVLLDLWSAGHDTTATTLISGFNQFMHHPEVVRKCREELLRLTDGGSRPLSLKDRADSRYLNATIAEIQRHASILNVNFWKTSDAPTKVNGYELDAGEILTAQMSALHVNEDIFKHAGEFMPERFLENEKLIHQLIPFGIGKRSCVGENLARAELFMHSSSSIIFDSVGLKIIILKEAMARPAKPGKGPDYKYSEISSSGIIFNLTENCPLQLTNFRSAL